MNGQVIRTYSRRKPAVLYQSEAKLIPSIPERLSKIRESRLNEKTLVIDDFNDTFDRVASDVVIPTFKSSEKQRDDGEKNDSDIVFKIPEQAKKSNKKGVRKNKKVDDEETQKTLSGKAAKRKRPRLDSSSDEDQVDASVEEAVKPKQRGKRGATKKRKVSPVQDDSEVKLKDCSVPLERFSLNMSVAGSAADKENLQSNNLEPWKLNSYLLSSTPRVKKARVNVSMHISPIVQVNRESLGNCSPSNFTKNNVSIKDNTKLENTDKNKLNSSESMFVDTLPGKVDHENGSKDSRLQQNPVASLHCNSQLLKVDDVNGKSFNESPLLFDDTLDNEVKKSKKTVSSMQGVVKNLSKSLDDSLDKETSSHQVDAKNSVHPSEPKFYESSFIPDDWTNDYTSTYEYGGKGDESSQVVENTTAHHSIAKDKQQNTIVNESEALDDSMNESNMGVESKQNIEDTSVDNRTLRSENADESCDQSTEKDSSVLSDVSETGNVTIIDKNDSKTGSKLSNDRSNDSSGRVTSNTLDSPEVDDNKGINDKVCTKQLYVVLERLNYEDKVNKSDVEQRLSLENATSGNEEDDSLNEENPQPLPQENEEPNESGSNDESDLQLNLKKMADPVKITVRRKVNKKKSLEAIAEDSVEQSKIADERDDSNANGHSKECKDSLPNDDPESSVTTGESQPVFLMPGKSWARSLSIINNFHNGQDLNELAVGRGQHWRESVQLVLGMQQDGVVQSSNEKKSVGKLSYPTVLQNRMSLVSTSPGRTSRRFSIRIVPSGKRSTLTNDFLSSDRTTNSTGKRKTSVPRKTSLRIHRDTLIQTEDDLIKSAKDIVFKRCNQTSYLPFSECFPDDYIDCCRKIGEGVYGEVFLYNDGNEMSVIKIIPIEGDQLVNSEPQKKFHEILSEIIISEELHKLKLGEEHNTNGFVGVKRIKCVIGKYPEKLIDLWKAYDEEKESENDCPSMFDDKQLYIILDLAHGGQDLEAYHFQNATESYSIFLQTAYSLAVAEKSLEFEHRDLHWGNLLVSKTNETSSSFKLNGEDIELPTKGVKVSVIDFTLSRMSYKGCKIFNDLAMDPTLFAAQGEYQFDIYRMMRDSVDNDWQQFNPYTNVLWLDYVLDKMITAANYKRTTTKVHKNAISKMRGLRKMILDYKSAFDFVSNCAKI